jgi:hypothetical protein
MKLSKKQKLYISLVIMLIGIIVLLRNTVVVKAVNEAELRQVFDVVNL